MQKKTGKIALIQKDLEKYCSFNILLNLARHECHNQPISPEKLPSFETLFIINYSIHFE